MLLKICSENSDNVAIKTYEYEQNYFQTKWNAGHLGCCSLEIVYVAIEILGRILGLPLEP